VGSVNAFLAVDRCVGRDVSRRVSGEVVELPVKEC
jgi:hypothetical protein